MGVHNCGLDALKVHDDQRIMNCFLMRLTPPDLFKTFTALITCKSVRSLPCPNAAQTLQ